ncbi:MAG: hypothetical protein ACYDBJ_00390 [Aggregatilineales bacterium]
MMNVSTPFRLVYVKTLELPHNASHRNGALAFLGLDDTGRLAVEKLYQTPECATDPDEDWIAQFMFDTDGTLRACYDEDCGRDTASESLSLIGFIAPPPVSQDVSRVFDYAGGRWRGLRETDRVPDVLQPMSIAEKLGLTARGVPGPILGVAESRAVSAARIDVDDADHVSWTLVCRRVRITYAVPLVYDADGLPYDYDTLVLFLAQWADSRNLLPPPPPLTETLTVELIGVKPTDVLYDARRARLYIADSGDAIHPAAIRIFQVESSV